MEQNIEDIINMQALPEHVAIIMDGNRRWAKKNNLSTPQGHKEGAENLKRIAKEAVIEIDLKRDRAMATHKQFHHLVIQFKGWDLFWIIKYFIRQ